MKEGMMEGGFLPRAAIERGGGERGGEDERRKEGEGVRACVF